LKHESKDRHCERLIKICLNEKYSKVCTDKHLSESFPFQNGLKEGDALSPLFCNFGLEYAVSKVQEIQNGPKLHVTHQVLAYADDVNLLGDNIDAINLATLIAAYKEVGLEIKRRGNLVHVVTSPECREKA
jgi:hypothetical protein